MKKNYFLFFICCIVPLLFVGQHTIPPLLKIEPKPSLDRTNEWHLQKSKPSNVKALQDTAFYEDFNTNNFTARGWTLFNNNVNNAIWQNTRSFTPGQFSTGAPKIASTTSSNGFMLLNGDRVNTPMPPTGYINMDTWFTSDTIWLNGAKVQRTAINPNTVWVSYQQYLRYCCDDANELVLEVSTDSTNWTTFDATAALPVNVANASTALAVVNNEINITAAVCGANYIFVRFRSTGNSHYYWMIDDFAVIEGPRHDLSLDRAYLRFHHDKTLAYRRPFYSQIPEAFFQPLNFLSTVSNIGEMDETNVEVKVDIHHVGDSLDSLSNVHGTPLGYVYSNQIKLDSLANRCNSNYANVALGTLPNNLFVPKVKGVFDVDFELTYDSIHADDIAMNNHFQQRFQVTDTVLARDDGTFNFGVGTHSFNVGGRTPGAAVAGDRLGIMYRIVPNAKATGTASLSNRTPTSISFFVSNNSRNVGVAIKPKIWLFDEDSATVNDAFVAEVATSSSAYAVSNSDLNTWLTLPLNNGSAITNGVDSATYVVGYEVTNIAVNKTFEVMNDSSTASLQADITAFAYFGFGWGWVDINPGIRLNFGNLGSLTDLPTPRGSSELLTVYPNPSEGNFVLDIQNSAPSTYQLRVLNQLGQVVQEKNINVNGSFQERLNLAHVEKGLYYLKLTGANGRQMKKIVIH